MKLENFQGLYKEDVADSSPFFIRSETIRERSILFDWQISPHIHNHLYQFFIVESGGVKINSSERSQNATGPLVLIIPPGMVHGFSYEPEVFGQIITIADSFAVDAVKGASQIQLFLSDIRFLSDFGAPARFKEIQDIALQFNNEVFGDLAERKMALQLLLGLFII